MRNKKYYISEKPEVSGTVKVSTKYAQINY